MRDDRKVRFQIRHVCEVVEPGTIEVEAYTLNLTFRGKVGISSAGNFLVETPATGGGGGCPTRADLTG